MVDEKAETNACRGARKDGGESDVRSTLRMMMLIVASLTMAWCVAQLGNTEWARGIRSSDAKYRAEHPRPATPVMANQPPARRPLRSYFKPFFQTAMLLGAPAGLTLIVLAAARQRKPPITAP